MKYRFALVAVCLAAITGPMAAAPPLADRLPADTLIYVGWAGRSLTFDGSLTGQLLAEPAVGDILSGLRSLVEAQLDDVQREQFAHAWQMGRIAWQHPLAVALLDMRGGADGATFQAVVLLEPGRDRDVFMTHLNALVQTLKFDFSEQTIGLTVCHVARDVPVFGELAYGFAGETFFFSFGTGAARRIVELASDVSLAASPTFKQQWSQVAGDGEQIAFYADIAALVDRIEQLVNCPEAAQTQAVSEMRRVIDALGLGKASAAVACTRIVDRGMYTRARLFTPAPHQGLLMPLAGGELTEADLAAVPGDADFVAAIKLSPQAAWDELLRVLAQLDPAARDQLLQAVAKAEQEIGLSISDDILSNLGDTILLSSAASQGGFLTGTAVSITVKDSEKLSAALARLEQYLAESFPAEGGLSIETTNAGRTPIRYLRGSLGFPWPIAPAWTIHKDKLYVALWPQVIASIIARNGAICPVTAEESYQQVRMHLGRSASGLCYINTPAILRKLYHWPLIGWTMGANALSSETAMEARPDWLPDLATLEKYLRADISSVSADDEGITFESYSALPTSGLVMMPTGSPALGLAVALPALPALHRARQKARQTVSMTNLKGIGMAVYMYRADHNDAFPTDLAELVPYVTAQQLVSPASGNNPPEVVDGRLVGEADYVLLSVSPSAPPTMLLAYEKPELSADGEVPVLFVDAHVDHVSLAQLQAMIAEAQPWIEAHKPAETNAGP